ncbi:MAG: hypothetical protein K0Q48_3091, partial [Bacillota bacterium]|nr:hypothetical protein [Bacillota bacterium]
MFKLKKLVAMFLAITLVFSLAACGGEKASTEGGKAGGELTEWEESSQILNMDQTEAELYELAKEEGTVTLYSISSRCTKVAEAFMAKYPGVECIPFDIKHNELLEKVTREHEAGQNIADVVHAKDLDGTLYNEYVLNKIFYNYLPTDIGSQIDDSLKETQTPLYIELVQLFYNEEANPNGAPIKNIWEITQP